MTACAGRSIRAASGRFASSGWAWAAQLGAPMHEALKRSDGIGDGRALTGGQRLFPERGERGVVGGGVAAGDADDVGGLHAGALNDLNAIAGACRA
jgi:hypothetical protein